MDLNVFDNVNDTRFDWLLNDFLGYLQLRSSVLKEYFLMRVKRYKQGI